MTIIEQVRRELLKRNDEFKKINNYDFWENHIKFVVDEALELAQEFGADKEIVELGALLHDIALVSKVGTREDHHINGAKITEEILTNFNYPQSKMYRVMNCVLHHRSSKNAECVEELCVCDADILAHFDNIPLMFDVSYQFHNFNSLQERTQWIIKSLEKDFNDLSGKTKGKFKIKYENILRVVFRSDKF